MKKQEEPKVALSIVEVEEGHLDIYVVSKPDSPLVINRLAEKARQQLLYPSPKKGGKNTRVHGMLKHIPREEFQSSIHRIREDNTPTLLAMPSTAFKKAMSFAALDMEGLKKSEIGRWTFVPGKYVSIYGIPKLYMDHVRSSDMNHTPDIRTRAMLTEWCARFTVTYVKPMLTANVVGNLVANSGMYVGIGDGRPEKGTFANGRFRICDPKDPDFVRIAKYGGRKVQIAAMNACEPVDEDSRELLAWFDDEVKRRNFEETKKKGKVNGPEIPVESEGEEVTL